MKEHEHNLREVANIVKDGYNGIKRESILAKNAREELTLRREMNFSCSRRSYIGKVFRRNADKGRCPFCLDEESVKYILLACLGISNWRRKFIIIIIIIVTTIIVVVVV